MGLKDSKINNLIGQVQYTVGPTKYAGSECLSPS